jgi:hypothetical protein
VSAQTKTLIAYLKSQRHDERFLLAAAEQGEAAQLIMAGESALPMGGFSGQAPFPTSNQLASLVAKRQLRFVMVGGGRGFGGFGGNNAASDNNSVETWVTSNCQAVDASAYGGSSTGSLYDCRPS